MANDYDRSDIVCAGPIFQAAKVESGAVCVRSDHVAGGLTSRDGKPLTHFPIAGVVPAETTIDGDSVIVRSVDAPRPVAVRFAWHELARPKLINRTGLPANSFRSDTWPLGE